MQPCCKGKEGGELWVMNYEGDVCLLMRSIYVSRHINSTVDISMRGDIFAHLLRLKNRYFDMSFVMY